MAASEPLIDLSENVDFVSPFDCHRLFDGGDVGFAMLPLPSHPGSMMAEPRPFESAGLPDLAAISAVAVSAEADATAPLPPALSPASDESASPHAFARSAEGDESASSQHSPLASALPSPARDPPRSELNSPTVKEEGGASTGDQSPIAHRLRQHKPNPALAAALKEEDEEDEEDVDDEEEEEEADSSASEYKAGRSRKRGVKRPAPDSGVDDLLVKPVRERLPQHLDKKDRNKISAARYRKRRKVFVETLQRSVASLQSKLSQQSDEIASLQTENKFLKEQLSFLRNLVGSNKVQKAGTAMFVLFSCFLLTAPLWSTSSPAPEFDPAVISARGRVLLSCENRHCTPVSVDAVASSPAAAAQDVGLELELASLAAAANANATTVLPEPFNAGAADLLLRTAPPMLEASA
jgi:hypothetical protein